MNDKELIGNRKAFHDYEILETYEAGIVLVGTEIKSLRSGGGSLQEAFIRIQSGEAFIQNFTITAYKFGNIHNHEERRERKLLLNKEEIRTLKRATEEKGLTVIPLAMYLVKGKAKLKIGIARGKKSHDKRQAIKEREDKRSIQREMKNFK